MGDVKELVPELIDLRPSNGPLAQDNCSSNFDLDGTSFWELNFYKHKTNVILRAPFLLAASEFRHTNGPGIFGSMLLTLMALGRYIQEVEREEHRSEVVGTGVLWRGARTSSLLVSGYQGR